MQFRITRRARGSYVFEALLDDGSVAVTGTPAPDIDPCLRAIEACVADLRAGTEVVRHGADDRHGFSLTDGRGLVTAESAPRASAAEAEALLVTLRAFAAAERFSVELPAPRSTRKPRAAEIPSYDLTQPSSTGSRGVESIRRDSDGLRCAHINDEQGRPLLYLRGVRSRHERDELLRALVRAMADVRRYQRRDDDGDLHLIVTTRTHRELARSRSFSASAERDAALAWLVQLAPTLTTALPEPTPPPRSGNKAPKVTPLATRANNRQTATTLVTVARTPPPAPSTQTDRPSPAPSGPHTPAQPAAPSRAQRGHDIVRRHVYMAVGLGLVPLPLVDVLTLSALQLDMIAELSRFYGVPWTRERAQAIVSALTTGLGSVALTFAIAGSLVKLVPVLGGLVGAVGVPVLAAAFTQALGGVFLMHFEAGGTLLSFDATRMRGHFRAEFERARSTPPPAATRGP